MMKLDINKVNIFERKKKLPTMHLYSCNFGFAIDLILLVTFGEMANNIKCFRVDVTLTPGM